MEKSEIGNNVNNLPNITDEELETSKYYRIIKPQFEKIKEAIQCGTPEYMICKQLKIGRTSWHNYKKEKEEFKELIQEAETSQIESVEGFLYRRCKGYFVEDTKTYIEKDINGKEKKKIEKHKREIPSSDSAIQFYLKNKKPEIWKERQEFKQDINQKISNLTIDIEEDEEENEIESN